MQQVTGWSDFPKSTVEFEDRFGSEDACYAYLAEQRWRDGFRCLRCGESKAWKLARRRLLECKGVAARLRSRPVPSFIGREAHCGFGSRPCSL
jgi:hypothetical protein